MGAYPCINLLQESVGEPESHTTLCDCEAAGVSVHCVENVLAVLLGMRQEALS